MIFSLVTTCIVIFTEVVTLAGTKRFKASDNQQPMPVVDLIDQESTDGTVKNVNEKHRYFFYPISIALVLSIPAGLIIIYFYLKHGKFFKHDMDKSVVESKVQLSDSSITQPGEEEVIPISDVEPEHSEIFMNTPFAQSLRLKEERKKHALAIERLKSKI